MKRQLRAMLDLAAYGSGALSVLQRQAARGITVLMYHRVLPDVRCSAYPHSNLVMPESAFEHQMAWLAKNCTVMTMRNALSEADQDEESLVPRVCVTFDDGYQDNAEVAAPILERHGLRATFFVTTGFIENGALFWFDRAALHWIQSPREHIVRVVADRVDEGCFRMQTVGNLASWMGFLKRCDTGVRLAILAQLDRVTPPYYERGLYAPMTLDQMQSLSARGHEIASHTVTHPILPQLSDDVLRAELQDSRAILERWLGSKVTGICYPNGNHDDRIVAAAQAAGYAYACTTRSGVNAIGADPMRLLRRMVAPGSVTSWNARLSTIAFRREVMGLYDLLRGATRR